MAPYFSEEDVVVEVGEYLRCFAILAWSLPCLCLEKADEVLRIFKAEVLADLRNAEGFINK